MSAKTEVEIRKNIYRVASERGYAVVEENLNAIVRGLIKRFEKHGGYYCPCRLVKDDPDWRKKITCPCAFLDDEIKEEGKCHCNLYKRA